MRSRLRTSIELNLNHIRQTRWETSEQNTISGDYPNIVVERLERPRTCHTKFMGTSEIIASYVANVLQGSADIVGDFI